MDDAPEETVEDNDDGMLIAITADPETWLPMIVCAVPATAEDIQNGFVPLVISPQVAYEIAGGLIQSANMVAAFHTELTNKSLEERKEIILLESSLINNESPFTP